MKRLVIVLLLAAVFQSAYAWRKNYPLGREGQLYSVRQTSDGGYIVTGGVIIGGPLPVYYDLFLMKTDSAGDTIWTRRYGGSGNDVGRCVRQTSDGGYVVVGFVDGPDFWYTGDLWLLKTDADGDTIWSKRYGGGWDDEGRWVEKTSDGGYIITGRIQPTGSGEHIWILKTDENGDTLWTRYYNVLGPTGRFVQEVSEGFIVCGSNGLIRTDSIGDTLWTYYFSGGGGHSACQASDGGYVFTATTWGSFGARDIFLIKTDADGDSVWGHSWGGADEDYSHDVQQTTDGGYVVVGETRSFGEEMINVWLIKTDANGDTTWTRILDGAYGRGVQQTSDDGYIICGGLTLIKTDSLGYAGVAEEPPATHRNWEVITSIGPQITLRYADRPQGFYASIFDATGRKVDELHAPLPSGSITWGEGQATGVYFVREESDHHPTVYRVVLIK